MRLIDANALKSKVEAMVIHKFNESDYEYGGNQAFDYVADILIDDAPTIDAVEVVRCKDCKYFELDHFDRINGIPLITAHEVCTKWSGGSKTSKDGFCFMGERRNNDNDRDTAET